MTENQVIDVDEVAARVLASPEAIYTLTPTEAVALAGFVVKTATGEAPPLVAPPAPAWPAMPASLAAAIANFIKLRADHADLRFESGGLDNFERSLAIEDAFNTLKTRFEEEFPNAHG